MKSPNVKWSCFYVRSLTSFYRDSLLERFLFPLFFLNRDSLSICSNSFSNFQLLKVLPGDSQALRFGSVGIICTFWGSLLIFNAFTVGPLATGKIFFKNVIIRAFRVAMTRHRLTSCNKILKNAARLKPLWFELDCIHRNSSFFCYSSLGFF